LEGFVGASKQLTQHTALDVVELVNIGCYDS
jgi:hypothetical protein